MMYLRLLSAAAGGIVLFVIGLRRIRQSLGRFLPPYPAIAAIFAGYGRPGALLGGAAAGILARSGVEATETLAAVCRAKLLSSWRATAVILGLPLSAAVFVQIVSIRPGIAAPYMMIAGLVVYAIAGDDAPGHVGSVVLGAGLLFFGVELVSGSVQELIAFAGPLGLAAAIESIGHNPFYLFVIAFFTSALIQSSVLTVVLVMAIGFPQDAATAAVLGAAAAAPVAALVASLTRGATFRQLAIAELLTGLLAASLLMALLGPFCTLVTRFSAAMGTFAEHRMLANAYLMFALFSAVAFMPLVSAVEQVAISLAGGGAAEDRHPLEVLEPSKARSPGEALDAAAAHTAGAGRVALEMARKSLSGYLVGVRGIERLMNACRRELDARLAVLEIMAVEIDEAGLSENDRLRKIALSYVRRDIGETGRIITAVLAAQAAGMSGRGVEFSAEQAQHFERFHRLVADDLAESLDMLEGRPARPDKVLKNAMTIEAARRAILRSHIHRVAGGVKADSASSAHFVDALGALRSIHLHVLDIVRLADTRAD